MGADRSCHCQPAAPSSPLPKISIVVRAVAQFPDGRVIEIESVSIEEAHDALWAAICREQPHV